MNKILRLAAIIVGSILLYYSMLLSNLGFNFSATGDASDFVAHAVVLSWSLAVAVSVVQFIVSTDFKQLNASLIIIGVFAYVYSIYTNYKGIVSFNGDEGLAKILAVIMDVAPELMIAWGMGQSRKGDLMGNLSKAGAFLWNLVENDGQTQKTQHSTSPNKSNYKPKHRPNLGNNNNNQHNRQRNF